MPALSVQTGHGPASAPQVRALVVDDAPATRAYLADVLLQGGIDARCVAGGAEALEACARALPDVVLLDARMPGIDGFEVCRRLQREPRSRDVPILFMTGLGATRDVVRGLHEGAADYLVKPVPASELLARIEVHVARARRLRQASEAMGRGDEPVLVVDADAGIVWLSEQARLRLGAAGVLKDDVVAAQLVAASRAAVHAALAMPPADGIVMLAPNLQTRLHPYPQTGGAVLRVCALWGEHPARQPAALTPRECQVLSWVARGKSNAQIGTLLGISPRTVNKHLDHIYVKLGVESRTAAAAIALTRRGPD